MNAVETPQKDKKGVSLSLEEMVDLKGKGLSLAQIGKMAGISKQAVSQRLKTSGLDPTEIGQFTKDRSLILKGKQRLVLSAITPEKVKTMSVRDAAVAAGILIDKQRLIDGESTANVAHFTKIDLTPFRGVLCGGCNFSRAAIDIDESGLCLACRGSGGASPETPKLTRYQGMQLCSSCRVYSGSVDAGLCETCRRDATACAVANPLPVPVGGPQ